MVDDVHTHVALLLVRVVGDQDALVYPVSVMIVENDVEHLFAFFVAWWPSQGPPRATSAIMSQSGTMEIECGGALVAVPSPAILGITRG